MKKGKTLVELAQAVEDINNSKKDIVAPSNECSIQPDGSGLSLKVGDDVFKPTGYMTKQIATSFDVPLKYMNKMMDAGQNELVANNLNTWMQKTPKPKMVRTVGANARAWLSNRYRPLDNYDLLASVLPILQEKQLELASCDLTETKLYLKVVSKTMEGEVKPGDVVRAGACISNSEIGAGAIQISPYTERLVCTNGMVSASAIRKHHVGRGAITEGVQEYLTDETVELKDRAFWMQVRDLTRSAFTEAFFQVELDKMKAAAGMKITGKVQEVVEVTKKSYGLTDDVGSMMLSNLIKGQDFTQWGLANCVTEVANTTKDYEYATELERVGGKIVELPKREWESLQVA